MYYINQISMTQAGTGRDRVTAMKTWADLQLQQARARGEALASEADEARLARRSMRAADATGPTLRRRLEGAIAGWRQPGKALAG